MFLFLTSPQGVERLFVEGLLEMKKGSKSRTELDSFRRLREYQLAEALTPQASYERIEQIAASLS